MSIFSGEIVNLLLSGLTFVVILAALMSLYIRRRDTKYDEKLHRIELEMFRRSIENEISDLTARLMSTETRWKDANHLLISSQSALNNRPGRSLLSRFDINENEPSDPKLVFVLTPFNDAHTETYEVIVRSCSSIGLKAARGDEEFIQGEVFPSILRLIHRAGIIVGNIDGRNPNVFYELGIAHALGKQTILVARRPEDIPFDIRTNRVVIYANYAELTQRLTMELSRAMADRQTLDHGASTAS